MNEAARQGISRNTLKLIAITTITIGHFFLYTLGTLNIVHKIPIPWRMILCYICFVGPPIFMFFISEGFHYTSSKKRYGERLLIFALITQVAHAIKVHDGTIGFDLWTFFFSWNVFFALFLGFLDLCILTSKKKMAIKVIGVFLTLALSYCMTAEWWVFGQLIILAFYYLKDHHILKFVLVTILYYSTFVFGEFELNGTCELSFWTKQTPYLLAFGMIGIALVTFLYKGKNGKKSKALQYFFYVFYPVHLLLIHLVNWIAG